MATVASLFCLLFLINDVVRGETQSLILNPHQHIHEKGSNLHNRREIPGCHVKTEGRSVCEVVFQNTSDVFRPYNEGYEGFRPKEVVKMCQSSLPGIVRCFLSKNVKEVYYTRNLTHGHFEQKILQDPLSTYCTGKTNYVLKKISSTPNN